jgi:hypothetical protein
MEAGIGEPLIIVPATISELHDWASLVQFMAQWFKVYFFELPGHGGSEPFREKFSSHQVAELVGQFADKLGHDRFNLMGFSFGGILAMRTFNLLSYRIDRLILIAPCVSRRALTFSKLRWNLIYRFNKLISHPGIQRRFVDVIHNPRTVLMTTKAIQKVGLLEDGVRLRQKLPRAKASTVSVLTSQINEILTTEFEVKPKKYNTPCYFAMSIYDPLLRFDTTHNVLQDHFSNIETVRLTYPFHQPPAPFTFDELNRDFYATVELFMHTKQQAETAP